MNVHETFEDLWMKFTEGEFDADDCARFDALLNEHPELTAKAANLFEEDQLLSAALGGAPADRFVTQTLERLEHERSTFSTKVAQQLRSIADERQPTKPTGLWRWVATAALVALAVTVGILVTPSPTARAPVSQVSVEHFAVVTAANMGRWVHDGEARDVGDALGAGVIHIESGRLEIEFDSGALVMLEGPAQLELVSANRAQLIKGRLAAHVPPRARGFAIDCPGVGIVDFGTEFALTVTPTGETDVHVYAGEVDAFFEAGNEKPVRLTSNQTRRMDPDQGQMTSIKFEPDSFSKPPPRNRFPKTTGSIRLLHHAPRRLQTGRFQHDYVLLIPEQRGLTLGADLPVTLVDAGRFRVTGDVLTQSRLIDAGRTVDSYLLHFDSVKTDVFRANGSVTFDRPVLGLIASQQHLSQSDAVLGAKGTRYGGGGRALEGDLVTLSADRRTVTIDWGIARTGMDEIRIVLPSTAGESN